VRQPALHQSDGVRTFAKGGSAFFSIDGTTNLAQFHNPAVSDGADDLVVIRPETGEWYIRFPSEGFTTTNYGSAQSGLPGDLHLQ